METGCQRLAKDPEPPHGSSFMTWRGPAVLGGARQWKPQAHTVGASLEEHWVLCPSKVKDGEALPNTEMLC